MTGSIKQQEKQQQSTTSQQAGQNCSANPNSPVFNLFIKLLDIFIKFYSFETTLTTMIGVLYILQHSKQLQKILQICVYNVNLLFLLSQQALSTGGNVPTRWMYCIYHHSEDVMCCRVATVLRFMDGHVTQVARIHIRTVQKRSS